MAKKIVYDKGPEEKENEGKSLTISVFFDGTQNNKTNTENKIKGEPQRAVFMNEDVSSYNDFIHPKPQIKEVEKAEISKPNNEVTYVSKDPLAEVVVYGFKRDGDSYENDYTNVARLFYGYVEKIGKQECIYIEGAGTEDNQPDDKAAVATGAFFSSIKAKARKACGKIFNKIKLYADGDSKYIDTLTIDVFGFSRGSATARYFTHFITCTDTKKEISKYYENHATPAEIINLLDKAKKSYNDNFAFMDNEKLSFIEKTKAIPHATSAVTQDVIPLLPELVKIIQKAYTDETQFYFQQQLKTKGIQVNNIAIRFVGLFDSVSSYGLFFDNDVDDLGLTAINKARKVVHFSAADEYRKNFALTNIISTGFKGVALSLPGVHSDVGGSYNKVEYEKTAFYIMAMSFANKLTTTLTHDTNKFLEGLTEPSEITRFKEKLIREGWLKPEQCKPEYRWWLKDSMQSAVLTGVLQKILTLVSLHPLAPDIIGEINDKLLKGGDVGMPPFGILYGHRKLNQGYSFIPMNIMCDFALEMGVPIKKSTLNNLGFVVPADLKEIEKGIRKYSNTVVNLRKGLMAEDHEEKVERMKRDGWFDDLVGAVADTFTADKQKKYLKKSKEISYLDFIKEKDLHYLRNNYLHWSSKSDSFGLDPNSRSVDYEDKRQIYEG